MRTMLLKQHANRFVSYLTELEGGVLADNVGLDSLLRGTGSLLERNDGLTGQLEIRLLRGGHFNNSLQ